jgi:HEAT repeat protein
MPLLLLLSLSLSSGEPPAAELAGRPLSAWVQDLDAANVLVRLEAIAVLADAGPDARKALPRLETLLRSEPLRLRLPAALAIYRISGRKAPAVAALTESLRSDAGTQSKMQALDRLLLMGEDASSAAAEMLALADSPDAFLRSRAVAVLAGLGRAILPAVLERLADPQTQRRRQASRVLLRLHHLLNDDEAKVVHRRLADEDSFVRLCCGRTLWARGMSSPEMVQVLTEAVRRGGVVGHIVLNTIEESVDARQRGAARPVLEVALRGDDPGVQVLAARELYRIDRKAEVVLPVYIAALKSPDRSVSPLAIAAIRELGRHGAAAIAVLVERFRDGDLVDRDAVQSFFCIGPAAVAPLVELLKEGRGPEFAVQVQTALSTFADEASPRVLPLLQHRDPELRVAACRVLGAVVGEVKTVAPRLVERLADESPEVRLAAIGSLQALGPAARQSVPEILERATALDAELQGRCLSAVEEIGGDPKLLRKASLERLNHPSAKVRFAALGLLWSVDPEHPACLRCAATVPRFPEAKEPVLEIVRGKRPGAARLAPVLIELLRRETDPKSRQTTASALGLIGPAAKEAAPLLSDGLTAPNIETRTWTVECLRRIGAGDRRRMTQALVEALDEEVGLGTRRLAIQQLGELGPEAADAVPMLLECLNHDDDDEMEAAARALLRISPERARTQGGRFLEKRLLMDVDPTKAARALLVLDNGHRGAVATLRRVLHEGELLFEGVLHAALDALGGAGPGAKAVLGDVRSLMRDCRPQVRIHAAGAAWRIGKDSGPAVQALVECLDRSQRPGVREAALETLAAMGPAAKAALPVLLERSQEGAPAERRAVREAIRAIDPEAREAGMP